MTLRLQKNINCIVDGTFAHEKAMQNIERSLKRGRKVYIMFVYQDPIESWLFTKARERKESRRIMPRDFIHGYFHSRDNVSRAKKTFGNNITVHVLTKNVKTSEARLDTNVDSSYIDNYLTKIYSEDELLAILENL